MRQENGQHNPDIVPQSASDHKEERAPYKLNVNGVVIESKAPKIVARDAIKRAGLDPNTPWIIVLKVAGAPKEVIDIDTVIDLTRPGIEKLRLTPKQIDNGEAHQPRRFDFRMLEKDEAHLLAMGAHWESIIEGGRRWLLIRRYQLPTGFTVPEVDIAIEVPEPYPGAQLDMFFCFPHLQRLTGQAIPQTESTETILGIVYQRWSRHRPSGAWNSAVDCLATHLALVDASLCREVE